MTKDLLKKKYQAEVDAYSKIGLYKRYSFLLSLSSDLNAVVSVLLDDNFTRTEITNTKSKYDHYHRKKNQSMIPGNAF
jgi:hypothetical protein